MKLIKKINGDEKLLKKFSDFMYSMNKEVAKDSFVEFLEYCDLTLNEWDVLKNWLNENGLSTYN